MLRVAVALFLVAAGCGNVKGYAETAAGLPPDAVFGWGLAVEGDVVRWRECSAIDTCGQIVRERPKRDVLAIETVGKATATDGGAVDVLKVSLAPRPKYYVPYTNPVRASTR
jgi:hypothetical protein